MHRRFLVWAAIVALLMSANWTAGREYSPRVVSPHRADAYSMRTFAQHPAWRDLQGDARGEVVINRCYFSRFFSSEVCRLMSAMDAGLFAGLSNGGVLTFSCRITEGQPCCRAHFRWEGSR